jgi:hypothetical protein
MHLIYKFILAILCTMQLTYVSAWVPVVTPEWSYSNQVQNDEDTSVRSDLVQPCGSVQEVVLWAGQHINAGTVTVSNDATNLYVTYATSGNWAIKKTHLYVGRCSRIPRNRPGNPMIGLFPYQNQFNPYVTSYTYTIPLSSFSDSCFCVAAHAELVLLGQNCTAVQTQTGWAGEESIGGKSWARKFYYCSQPCPEICDINVAIESVSPTTCSANNGSASIVAQGGSAPYTYTVVNTSTGSIYSNSAGDFNNLSPGDYFVFVNDNNQCAQECIDNNFEIGFVPSNLEHTAHVSYSCTSQTGTTVTLITNSDSGPFLYSIGGAFQTANEFLHVSPGVYNTTVIDANGCSSSATIEVETNTPLTLTVESKQNATCSQYNGSITLAASGGQETYVYTITNLFTNQEYTNTTGEFNGLPAGLYASSVTDANGCTNQNACVLTKIFNILKGCHQYDICKKLEDNKLVVYPNPASNVATISFMYTPESEFNLMITDMNGKIMLEQPSVRFESFDLDLTDFSPGTYMINVYDAPNNQRLTSRLVVVSK